MFLLSVFIVVRIGFFLDFCGDIDVGIISGGGVGCGSDSYIVGVGGLWLILDVK